mmetsp:Transcript_12444/g.27113  ORF Transcript_12444/g.27113 Transcript_12444/m.27113 type:complete len:212 (+) Transcript_12444:123-758(+)
MNFPLVVGATCFDSRITLQSKGLRRLRMAMKAPRTPANPQIILRTRIVLLKLAKPLQLPPGIVHQPRPIHPLYDTRTWLGLLLQRQNGLGIHDPHGIQQRRAEVNVEDGTRQDGGDLDPLFSENAVADAAQFGGGTIHGVLRPEVGFAAELPDFVRGAEDVVVEGFADEVDEEVVAAHLGSVVVDDGRGGRGGLGRFGFGFGRRGFLLRLL